MNKFADHDFAVPAAPTGLASALKKGGSQQSLLSAQKFGDKVTDDKGNVYTLVNGETLLCQDGSRWKWADDDAKHFRMRQIVKGSITGPIIPST